MNIEKEHVDFEAWCKRNEYDHAKRLDGTGYNNEATKRAREAWQARAALQSQDREDAERYRWLCDKFGITKLPCAIERIIAGDVYVADGKAGIDAAIDHARRIEGES